MAITGKKPPREATWRLACRLEPGLREPSWGADTDRPPQPIWAFGARSRPGRPGSAEDRRQRRYAPPAHRERHRTVTNGRATGPSRSSPENRSGRARGWSTEPADSLAVDA